MAQPTTRSSYFSKSAKYVVIAVCLVAVLLFGWLAFSGIGSNLEEQGLVSTRNAILNSAKQCCAIEGSYPTSLAYLEENYGLVLNYNKYLITYDVFAQNVMPNVVVLAK